MTSKLRAILCSTLLALMCATAWASDAKVTDAQAAASQPTAGIEVVNTDAVVPPLGTVTVPGTDTVVEDASGKAAWWQLLIKHALELVFLVLGLMATAFVRVLGKKYGFADYTEKLNDVLTRATAYAEQAAAKALKVDGKPMESAKKLELALGFAEELAKDYKLPQKGNDWWEGKLESWLGIEKVKANGKA
jgi:hypothetical protein